MSTPTFEHAYLERTGKLAGLSFVPSEETVYAAMDARRPATDEQPAIGTIDAVAVYCATTGTLEVTSTLALEQWRRDPGARGYIERVLRRMLSDKAIDASASLIGPLHQTTEVLDGFYHDEENAPWREVNLDYYEELSPGISLRVKLTCPTRPMVTEAA